MTDASKPPPIPSQPLDYSGGGGAGLPPYPPRAPRVSFFSAARFGLGMAVVLIVLGIFLFVIPRIETVYADFGVKLPGITMLVLDISRFLRTPIGWVFTALASTVVGVMLAVLPIRGRGLRLLIVTLLALLVLALALAVILPLVNFMEAVSSPTGKR